MKDSLDHLIGHLLGILVRIRIRGHSFGVSVVLLYRRHVVAIIVDDYDSLLECWCLVFLYVLFELLCVAGPLARLLLIVLTASLVPIHEQRTCSYSCSCGSQRDSPKLHLSHGSFVTADAAPHAANENFEQKINLLPSCGVLSLDLSSTHVLA